MRNSLLPEPYKIFHRRLFRLIDKRRVFTDPLHTLAYGTDASLYRLIPKIVIKALNEEELSCILSLAREFSLPVTVRTAGTSLSGQSSTDSILVALNWGFKKYEILDDGAKIKLEPGVVGEFANHVLKRYHKKIGPDPASIASAMVGGIISNNSSGMCCGVEENSYKTIDSLRIMLYDGTILDTGDPENVSRFRKSHTLLLKELTLLAEEIKADPILKKKIITKYKIKNTTGYSLNALVDFHEPIDILTHLIVGSEGTLAIILNVTLRTVEEHPLKASAMAYYSDVYTACKAVEIMKTQLRQYVYAVELFDRISIRTVEDRPIAPPVMKTLGIDACSLLIETRSFTQNGLEENIRLIAQGIAEIPTLEPIEFFTDPKVYSTYWTLRKGLIPSIGAIRETGTTVIIEDVAFPIEHLAEATMDMQKLFKKYGYGEGIVMGHALEGNLHLVFAQEFSTLEEVTRYQGFMDELCDITAKKYNGSLKAEHGTGRNVAPFVEMEWGSKAYSIMKRIKEVFDPRNILNPGVILNSDPHFHIKNLKIIPETHPLVDKCIECGFCESECPSRTHSLTPRQRIVINRELSRLSNELAQSQSVKISKEMKRIYHKIKNLYRYEGEESCVSCSMCEPACPVFINTGKLMKELRANKSSRQLWMANFTARHFSFLMKVVNFLLLLRETGEKIIGIDVLPPRFKYFPRRVRFRPTFSSLHSEKKVIYFPSCLSRTFSAKGQTPLVEVIHSLLFRAGYEVIYPSGINQYCCGMPYSSKGFKATADFKSNELIKALTKAGGGQYPILIDTTPCIAFIRDNALLDSWEVFDPITFIKKYLLKKLLIQKLNKKVAIHTTCSASRLGLEEDLFDLARTLAEEVVAPQEIKCCGFAGDKGFKYPQLNASALITLKDQIQGCQEGYSTSITCEIGLGEHGRIPYRSIFYLLDEASQVN